MLKGKGPEKKTVNKKSSKATGELEKAAPKYVSYYGGAVGDNATCINRFTSVTSSSIPHSSSSSSSSRSSSSPASVTSYSDPLVDVSALKKLKQFVDKKELVDLHSHLLGCGTPEFWFSIMMDTIPILKEEEKIRRFQQMTHENWSAVDMEPLENFEPDREFKLEGSNEWSYPTHPVITYDVVYSIETLAKSFGGIEEQATPQEKEQRLCRFMDNFSSSSGMSFANKVQNHLIYNAREQEFMIRRGVTNQELIRMKPEQSFWVPCFMMSNSSGETASTDDLRCLFSGRFTPQFFPMRYALKDDMYSQYPDILTLLMRYVLDRYSKAGVSYVELSLGFGDLVERPWIYRYLQSVQQEFGVEYRFLVGFTRSKLQKFKMPRTSSLNYDQYVLQAERPDIGFYEEFELQLQKLREALLQSERSANPLGLHKYCVGLDYFGDEFTFPYCPFSSLPFVTFLKEERAKRAGKFGFRIHCGEFDEQDTTEYLTVHLGITSRTICQILTEVPWTDKSLPPPLRIGHGLAFRHFLHSKPICSSPATKKACVWIVNALELIRSQKIPIEFNLMSNRYLTLVGQGYITLFHKSGYKVFLSTDNDGIWPCSCTFKDRCWESLAGEYASAIVGDNMPRDDRLMAADVTLFMSTARKSAFDLPSS